MPNVPVQYKYATGVVDAKGNCTINFETPPLGLTWTGSITITNASLGSIWNVQKNNTTFDVMTASYTVGNIQASSGDSISLIGSGVLPGTTITAVWMFKSEVDELADPVLPAHDALNPLTSYTRLVFQQTITFSTTFVGIPITPNDRSLIVMIANSTTCYINACVGQTTGTDYFPPTKPLAAVAALNKLGNIATGPYVIPVPGAIESAVNLAVIGPSSGSATVSVYATPDVYPGYNFNEPLNVTIFDPNATTVPYTATKANAATGTTTALLAAPAANFFWEVSHMGLWQVAAGTTLQHIAIQGHTTAIEYLLLKLDAAAPGNEGQIFSDAKFLINEGLDVINGGTGATCSGMVLARQVGSTFSGPT